MEEKQVKLEELMKDEAFLDAIFSKESSEEVQKLFAEKGVELTMEEVEGLAAAILQAAPEGNGELSEDALDSVAGGRLLRLTSFLPSTPLILPPYVLLPRWIRKR